MNTLLTSLLKRFKLYPSNILALGDDEVSGLSGRSSDHQLWGIVSDRTIVDTAKAKFPHAKVYAQKLEIFRVTGMMQLTYALHQQLNTIPVSKRVKLFETIHKHSMPYALVVMDCYLPAHFESIAKAKSHTTLAASEVSLDTRSSRKSEYTHESISFVLEKGSEDLYRKHHSKQTYYTSTTTDLKQIASQYFESVSILDIKGNKLGKNPTHILLVCQMGGPEWKPKLIAKS